MRIGIIGAGYIGTLLAKKLLAAGYQVELSNSRGPASLAPLIAELGKGAFAVTTEEAAENVIIILAVRWVDVQKVVTPLRKKLEGKVIIDTTNPFGNDGALLDLKNPSASELIASYLPESFVIKAFNSLYGEWIEANPEEPTGNRVAFISGDNKEAKTAVRKIIEKIGFAPVDLGSLEIGGLLQQAGNPLAGINLLKLT
jgi:predicted dinucleotide-binding enzyme